LGNFIAFFHIHRKFAAEVRVHLRLLNLTTEEIDSLGHNLFDQDCLNAVSAFIAKPRPSTASKLPVYVCTTITPRNGKAVEMIQLSWLNGEESDEEEETDTEEEQEEAREESSGCIVC
jgi:hypothetical protein